MSNVRPQVDVGSYHAAQLALFDRLVAGHANATIVPLRAEYVGAATCLTLIHMLPKELSALIEDRVLRWLLRQRYFESHLIG